MLPYLEHVGIGTDWNWGYRDQATVEREWIARDAVKATRRLASHQVGESAIAAMEDEIDKAIQASVKRASQAPIPARTGCMRVCSMRKLDYAGAIREADDAGNGTRSARFSSMASAFPLVVDLRHDQGPA